MHGSLVLSKSTIGVDKVATLKKLSDNALLLDAGDATQEVYVNNYSGARIIEIEGYYPIFYSTLIY